MGIYINTTTTVTRRINYFYRCSKCGAVIGQSAFVSGAAKYNKYNGETAANNAYSRANADSNSAVTKALKKAAQGDYRPMRIKAKCPKCKHREPWQKMRISIIVILTPVMLLLGGIYFPDGLKSKNTIETIVGGVMLAIPLITIVGGIIRRRQMNAQTAQLPEVSRPHFFMPDDQKMAQDALIQCNYTAGEEVVHNYPNFPGQKKK